MSERCTVGPALCGLRGGPGEGVDVGMDGPSQVPGFVVRALMEEGGSEGGDDLNDLDIKG